MQKAEGYFGELKVTVEAGQNQTDRFHKIIVESANQKEQYVMLNSEGVKIVVQSFAAAWEEVDMAMNNDPEGFMKITFVEILHLQ